MDWHIYRFIYVLKNGIRNLFKCIYTKNYKMGYTAGGSHESARPGQAEAVVSERPPAFFDCRRPDRGEYQKAHARGTLEELPGRIVRAYHGHSDKTTPPTFGLNISFTLGVEALVAMQLTIADPKELESLANEVGLKPGEDLASKLVGRSVVALRYVGLAFPSFGFYVKRE